MKENKKVARKKEEVANFLARIVEMLRLEVGLEADEEGLSEGLRVERVVRVCGIEVVLVLVEAINRSFIFGRVVVERWKLDC